MAKTTRHACGYAVEEGVTHQVNLWQLGETRLCPLDTLSLMKTENEPHPSFLLCARGKNKKVTIHMKLTRHTNHRDS